MLMCNLSQERKNYNCRLSADREFNERMEAENEGC